MVAHGCTAGRQMTRSVSRSRWRTAWAPDLEIIAPVRDPRVQAARAAEVSRRTQASHPGRSVAAYSVNRGLWGRDHRRQGDP